MRAAAVAILLSAYLSSGILHTGEAPRLLDEHFLVTWYGNPHSHRMGILGELKPPDRAKALRQQAAAYAGLTEKRILMAYHLVAVVAQPTQGADRKWRRRESDQVIAALLSEARANGFHLILDIQPGHSTVAAEMSALAHWLREPDVHLALDPEFAMDLGEVPGQQIGQMSAADINEAIGTLETIRAEHGLPPKLLMVHQFRFDMLPDKARIRPSATIELVLNMDGVGSQPLKHSTWQAIMRQPFAFSAVKLFYRQDTNLFSPGQVLALRPLPSAVVYQ